MQAGARKVYAVEASGMVKYARQLVAASGQAPHNSAFLVCPDCVSIQLLLPSVHRSNVWNITTAFAFQERLACTHQAYRLTILTCGACANLSVICRVCRSCRSCAREG